MENSQCLAILHAHISPPASLSCLLCFHPAAACWPCPGSSCSPSRKSASCLTSPSPPPPVRRPQVQPLLLSLSICPVCFAHNILPGRADKSRKIPFPYLHCGFISLCNLLKSRVPEQQGPTPGSPPLGWAQLPPAPSWPQPFRFYLCLMPESLLASFRDSDILLLVVVIFLFLGLHLWHMELPRLGVESELRPQQRQI